MGDKEREKEKRIGHEITHGFDDQGRQYSIPTKEKVKERDVQYIEREIKRKRQQGSVKDHEITHSVDDQGRQYDSIFRKWER